MGMERLPAGVLAERKRRMRKTSKDFRRSLQARDRHARSQVICRRIRALPEWTGAATVGVFHALPGEVDLTALLAEENHKTVAWPVLVRRGAPLQFREGPPTVRGPYGILEPPDDARLIPLSQLDLVVVPGLAFDAFGCRLGQGGGFYDRTLVHTHATRLAVCFREQVVASVPSGEHDCGMDLVVTEDGVLRPRGR